MTTNPLGEEFDAVLEAAQTNQPRAFERLYLAYARPVHAYIRAQGAPDPDDLHGEVFLRAFRALPRFKGSEPRFRSWLFAIAHNAILDERRHRTRHPLTLKADVESPESTPDAADTAVTGQATSELMRLVADLPEAQRDVIVLRIVADLSVEQTAKALGRSTGAIKQLQRRALVALRQQLADPP